MTRLPSVDDVAKTLDWAEADRVAVTGRAMTETPALGRPTAFRRLGAFMQI